jgi:hypothetical protein
MIGLASFNRWQAAGIHLALSALIAATVVTVMLALWYPPPYFDAMGGTGLLKLVVGVDVTLGPLLTLIVYNPAKKSLRFDLAVIATLQLAALAYGIWVTFGARPVYTVFVKDRFEVVAANQLDAADLAAGPPEYRSLSLTGPRVVGVRFPTDAEEHNKLVFSGVAGKDAQSFPKYYVPYADVVPEVLAKAKPLAKLASGAPEHAALVTAFAATSGLPEGALGYVPLMGREGAMTAAVDLRDGRMLGLIAIDPY